MGVRAREMDGAKNKLIVDIYLFICTIRQKEQS